MSVMPARKSASHAPSIPTGYVRLADLRGRFGDHPESRLTRKRSERWAGNLPSGQCVKVGRGFVVSPNARLPDGQTVLAYVKCGASQKSQPGRQLPPESHLFTAADWKRYDDAIEYKRLFDAHRASCPRMSGEEHVKLFAVSEGGRWAREHGLLLSVNGRKLLFERIDPTSSKFDGARDGRGGRFCTSGKRRGSRYSAEAKDLFLSLYLDPRRRSVAWCWRQVEAVRGRNCWEWPAYETVRRLTKQWATPAEADYYRLGEKRWRALYLPRIQRDWSQTRPGEVLIGDHAQCDFICLASGKPVRAWLTAWMDARSRFLTAWAITTRPNTDVLLRTLADHVKAWGAPVTLRIDNGKDFRAKALTGGKKRRKQRADEERMRSVCGRLGIDVSFCQPFNPQGKPIERLFGTIHDQYDKSVESYCGSSPETRPEDLYERMRAGKVKVPTIEEARELFGKWLTEVYHQTAHSGSGVDWKSPEHVFYYCNPIPKRTLPEKSLALLLMKTVEVKVSKNGVLYAGVHYGWGSLALLKRIGSSVLLRINQADASAVDVLELDGRFIVRASNYRCRGLSQDDIAAGKRTQAAARKLAKAALPASAAARKTTVEHAIAAQAEYTEQRRVAVGAERVDVVAAQAMRPLSLLYEAAEYVALSAPREIGGSPVEVELEESACAEPPDWGLELADTDDLEDRATGVGDLDLRGSDDV